MANVLGELFGDIAKAIREKTGDTATMKPAQFPEKISEIETEPVLQPLDITENGTYTAPAGVDGYNPVTVDVEPVLQDKTITENGEYTADAGFDGLGKVTVEVAGSGGGSLPAGLYWEFGEFDTPNYYYQRWFVYKGELYAMTRINANNGNEYNLYKLSGRQWTTVISSGTLTVFGSGELWRYLEFGGLIHMIGCEKKYHYVFNGSHFTSKNNLPNSIANSGAFIQNGKLKAYSYYDGNVYVWNESTDTWTSEAKIGEKYYYYNFISDGTHVYYVYSHELYKYENGVSTKIGSFAGSSDGVLYNSYFYNRINKTVSATGKSQDYWYKFDFSTGVNTHIGYGQDQNDCSLPVVFDNKILSISLVVDKIGNVSVMHEVTE